MNHADAVAETNNIDAAKTVGVGKKFSRMIEAAFQEEGVSYLINRSGANLMSGIVTEFVMNSTVTGKCRKEYAVIECDEAAARTSAKSTTFPPCACW